MVRGSSGGMSPVRDKMSLASYLRHTGTPRASHRAPAPAPEAEARGRPLWAFGQKGEAPRRWGSNGSDFQAKGLDGGGLEAVLELFGPSIASFKAVKALKEAPWCVSMGLWLGLYLGLALSDLAPFLDFEAWIKPSLSPLKGDLRHVSAFSKDCDLAHTVPGAVTNWNDVYEKAVHGVRLGPTTHTHMFITI